MSDKQRLINRLHGRRVNLERLAERISEPMAGRVLAKVTRLYDAGQITESTHRSIVKAIEKKKPRIKAKPPKKPYYSSPAAPIDIILRGFARYL